MSSNISDSDTDCDLNPLEDVKDGSIDKIDEEEPKSPAAKPRRVSGERYSKLWDIFEKVPGERGIACCRLCQRRLSFRTTSSNLKKHLHHVHALEVAQGILPPSVFSNLERPQNSAKRNKKADEKDTNSVARSSRPYRSNSIAWQYFSITCRARRRARCKLCSKIYSYATTVTNLLTHLERRHNNVHLDGNQQIPAANTSPLWAYFKSLDEAMQLAACLLCKKRFDYSDDCRELHRHLARKHPHIDLDETSSGKTFMVTDSGDVFEIDVNKSEPGAAESDNDENEPYEADYLDVSTYDEPEEQIQSNTKRNAPKIQRISQKLLKQQPEDLELSNPKDIEEDSLDIFGRYIVSLMKKMPKNTSDKLQYKILKQLFEAQSEVTTVKENNVTSNSEQSPDILLADNDD